MNIAWRYLAASGLLLSLAGSVVEARDSGYDPPSRVAYLSHSAGDVSYSPAGEDVWLDVSRNRPLVRGDRLWTERRALAELQLGSASLRMDEQTSLEVLALDDNFAQLQVAEGTLALTVRRLARGQVIEIATPQLALSIDRPGRYRIDVDADRDETTVAVWEGSAEAYGERSEFSLLAGEAVRFYSGDLSDYEVFGLPRDDTFDRYCLDRDRQLSRSVALRYVDDDTAGFSSLDEYGSWRSVNSYGNVWFPTTVARDWAPYRDGRWVWQEPWGWTWVDNAPWGFAPSHYGRWAYVTNRWGWIPGPRNVRAVYAPALVAFVGGSNWSLSISGGNQSPIGWFPLGPREVYVPSYQASRDYFSRVNVNNTVVNVSVINSVYGNYSRGSLNVGQIEYANRGLPGAVTAVPSSVFVNSRSVRQEIIRLERNGLANSENLRVATVAPSRRAVLGAAIEADGRPAREVFDRRVFARTAPPPELRSFADREQVLQRTPGRASAPSAGTPRPQRGGSPANVRVLQPESQSVDAREVGSRRRGDDNEADGGAPQILDRAIESQRAPDRGRRDSGTPGSPADLPPGRSRPPRDQQLREPEAADRVQQGEQLGGERQRDGAVRDRPAPMDRDDAARAQQRQQQANENQRQETMRGQRAQEQADSEAAAARQGQQRDAEAAQRQRENAGRERQLQSDREDAAREQQRQQQAVENQRQADLQVDKQREQGQRDAAERDRSQRDESARQQQQAERQAAENQRQADLQVDRQREQEQRDAADRERSQRDESARQQQQAEQRQAEQQQAEQQEAQRQQQEMQRQEQDSRREQQQERQREAEESAAQNEAESSDRKDERDKDNRKEEREGRGKDKD